MESNVTEMQPVSVVTAVTTAEIDVQIATAQRYKRDLAGATKAATDMATADMATAQSCMYALPRADKKIEGGSVRLAEIVAASYGNLRVQTRMVDDGDRNFVTAMAGGWDLQSNTAISIEKRRRVTDKRGRRYGDDMIITTSNACASIAFRDAVFKVVPRAFWQPVYEAARRMAIGDASTLSERRISMVNWFGKMGVFVDRVLESLGHKTVDEITLDDLETLHGTANLIKDGQLYVDDAFPEEKKEAGTLADRMRANADPEETKLHDEIKRLAGITGQQAKLNAMKTHGVKLLPECHEVAILKEIVLDLAAIAETKQKANGEVMAEPV